MSTPQEKGMGKKRLGNNQRRKLGRVAAWEMKGKRAIRPKKRREKHETVEPNQNTGPGETRGTSSVVREGRQKNLSAI